MNGYGAANYGINIYGQAAYVDAAAIVAAASAVTATAQQVFQALALFSDKPYDTPKPADHHFPLLF